MYKIFSWIAVILWMGVIFYLSHQPATESSELSIGITEVIIQSIEKVTPHEGFNIGSFNSIVRTNAHFFTYLVLGILMINTLRKSGVHGYRSMGMALLICVLYAVSDEVHQIFIPGRGAEVKDVLIDSAGASVGVLMYLVISRLMKKEIPTEL